MNIDQTFIDYVVRTLDKVGLSVFSMLVTSWFMFRSDKRQDKIIEIQDEILKVIRGNHE